MLWTILKICVGILIFQAGFGSSSDQPCLPLQFNSSSVVCVCTRWYCDSYDDVIIDQESTFALVTSSESGQRFATTYGIFQPVVDGSEDVHQYDHFMSVDPDTQYQSILGFGGAFTDATGHNVLQLSPELREHFIRSYFSDRGLRYSIGKVPIGGADFSLRPYTNDDNPGDVSLAKFQLTYEDNYLKIPLVRRALELRRGDITLSATPWSAPGWMKTNGEINGRGFLKKENYQRYADYIVRFLQEYSGQGIDFWGVSTGNEPFGTIAYAEYVGRYNNMGWLPWWQRDFIKNNLGPALRREGFSNVTIIIVDDQRQVLPFWALAILDDPEAAKYVGGIGVHWYGDDMPFATDQLGLTRLAHPDKFILYTEACTGFQTFEFPKVDLGSWDRGERYASNIIMNLNMYVVGWTDWNMALSMTGGPNWVGLFADSPIIVNAERNEFYKQPMYYALGHFSRFIPPGSKRIGLDVSVSAVESVAVQRPDGAIVVVMLNKSPDTLKVGIRHPSKGIATITIPPKAVQTVIYRS